MLARSRVPVTAAILTLCLGATAASAVTINFAKVQITYRNQDDLDRQPSHGVSDGMVAPPTNGLPPGPPVLVFTQGVASWTDSSGTELRRRPVNNLGSSGQDGVSVSLNVFDSQPPAPSPTLPPFPATSFFDIFTEISVPTADGSPSNTPTSLRRLEVHNLGSSGQDGVSIDFVVVDPTSGNEIPMNEIVTATSPGVHFNNSPTVNAPAFVPDMPGNFQSFFDIFFELDGTQSFDPNTPMFRIDTTITPEPASLSLAALGVLPFLVRRRRTFC